MTKNGLIAGATYASWCLVLAWGLARRLVDNGVEELAVTTGLMLVFVATPVLADRVRRRRKAR